MSRARCRTGPTRTDARCARAAAATASSARRLVAPITDDGSTALSVETRTNRSTPLLQRRAQGGQRPADVRVDRVGWVMFHHRHVLVGSGVQHHDRPVVGDDAAHRLERATFASLLSSRARGLPLVRGVPESRSREQRQLPLDVVERSFGAVEEHQDAPDRDRRLGAATRTRSTRPRRSRAPTCRATRSRRPASSMTTGSRRSKSST